MLERYTIHPEALMPYEDGNVVFYTDAQQAVERLEAQVRVWETQATNMQAINAERCAEVERLERERDAAQFMSKRAFDELQKSVEQANDLKQQVAQLRGANTSLIAEWTVLQELLERAGFPEGDGGLMGQVDAIYTAHTTLRGLVRTACERWRAQTNAQEGISFRMSMKELDATLPREGGVQGGTI